MELHESRPTLFFARRYADILTDQYPIALYPGPKLVVHLVPSRDFLAGEQVDVFQFKLNDVPYLHQPTSLTHHSCADGRIFWLDYDRSASVSTLLMHSGVIEGILSLDIGGSGQISMPFVEESAIDFVQRARATPRVAEILGLPFTARIALVGTQGMPLGSNDVYQRFHPKPVRQLAPVLALPDTLIEDETEHVDAALYLALKRAWNAWGFEGSPNYRLNDDANVWRHRRK